MPTDYPPSPQEFQSEYIQVFDEANGIFVPIPHGFVAPSRSAPDDDPNHNDEDLLAWTDPEPGSTPSGTDFEETQEALLKTRKRKRELGREHSDTERDDMEDNDDLRDDVVDEAFPSPSPRRHKKKARKGKGKGKERARDTSDMSEGVEDEEVDEVRKKKGKEHLTVGQALHPIDEEDEGDGEVDDTPRKKKPGRWPKTALQMCEELGTRVTKEAGEIAEKFGKDVSEVIMRAGLGFQFHKVQSQWHLFQVWYNHNYQKPPESECLC